MVLYLIDVYSFMNKGVLILLFIFCTFPFAIIAQEKENKSVLVLFADDQSLPAMREWDRGIEVEFQAQQDFNISITREYLDLSKYNEVDYFVKVADLLNYKYRESQPDLILTIFDLSCAFFLERGREVFPAVPVIFAGIEQNTIDSASMDDNMIPIFHGSNCTQGTISVAIRQNPSATQAVIISGNGYTERAWIRGAQQVLESFSDRLKFRYITGYPIAEIKKEVQDLPENTFILYFPFLEDRESNRYVATEVLNQIAAVSSVPIYSSWEIFVGHGSVGGFVRDFSTQAKVAANKALAILDNPSSANFSPIEITDHRYIFDHRQLKKWSFEKSTLPAGSEIRFKEDSFWEKYFYRIIVVAALVSIQFVVIGYLLAARRKNQLAQKELIKAEQKYRTVADYTKDWEYWQNPDGSMQWVSPSCEAISGYSSNAIMENPSLISDMVVADDRKIWDAHQCNITGKVNEKEIRFRIRELQGDTRWIEHTCQPVVDAHGNYLGIRANNRDITERELYKTKTQMLQSELIHVERVSTISTLSYALAHEINQPLTSIRGYAQAALRFLDKDSSEEENIRMALQGIVADNKRAASIVGQLRDLVRKDNAQFKRIDLNVIIKDVLNLLNSELILHKVSVKLDLDSSEDRVIGDAIQLQQVFMNLLTNGIRAVGDQKVGRREITISTKAENDKELSILFNDSGSGIQPDKLEEIFQPFHTTNSTGLGLGLAISKLIIESHDGKLRAENNHSGGATFIVTLPLSAITE